MTACASCGFGAATPFRFCPECGAEQVQAASHEQRKTVTVLFCDLAGSTALGETIDPERLRAMLAGYFERMKEIVEGHGGSVEKFIGDAVMAVFGVPLSHEDDALRAVRAAAEMRDALPELELEGRIGVMTGEVVAGTDERLATGDPVNVAARLEQAAGPGEILIGEPTFALVRDSVEVDTIEPLPLKGKTSPVAAYRLRSVGDTPERAHDTPFVGRDRELALVREAIERSRAASACELVTVVGDAGVGKSRLVAEALETTDATVGRGRCLPYGEGITYWPVVEVLKQLGVMPADETAAATIRSLFGETDDTASADDIAWAFRKTLEHAATRRPLVVVLDDIQWGEPTFHDLVEHVALLSTGFPILLLCMARPELTERRPDWPVTLRLGPLGDGDVGQLIPGRIAGPARERIAAAAGGNPLFVTELLAMTGEDDDATIAVPPTLHALLAARLDQLDPSERSALEWGSVEGEVFHRAAVQALAPAGEQVTPRLTALARKGLIRPDRSPLGGEDAFRFHHLLIRDAAYESLPKSTRADCHRRLAAWLDESARSLVEVDDLVGYHLERAHRYRSELGLPVDPELAAGARRRLTDGGIRAARRQDFSAAVSLLERAAALITPDEVDIVLEVELGEALTWTSPLGQVAERFDDLATRAAVAGNRRGALCARIRAAMYLAQLGDDGAAEALPALIEEALPVFEAEQDDIALFVTHLARAEVDLGHGLFENALRAYELAFDHAERAGYHPSGKQATRAWCRFAGTTPIPEVIAWIDEHDTARGDQFFRAYRAWSLAMIGRIDEARGILTQARSDQADRGGGVLLANLVAFESTAIELLAGDAGAAAAFAAEGCRLHEELGQPQFLAPASALLAEALYRLDRLDEAEEHASRAGAMEPAKADRTVQMQSRQVRAKVLARRGAHEEAQALARLAVEIGETTQMPDVQGDAYADLAEVLELGGEHAEAAATLEQALERYERKGNLVSAQRIRDRLGRLSDAAA